MSKQKETFARLCPVIPQDESQLASNYIWRGGGLWPQEYSGWRE